MIIVDDEPGALPLMLIFLGVIGLIYYYIRFDKRHP